MNLKDAKSTVAVLFDVDTDEFDAFELALMLDEHPAGTVDPTSVLNQPCLEFERLMVRLARQQLEPALATLH